MFIDRSLCPNAGVCVRAEPLDELGHELKRGIAWGHGLALKSKCISRHMFKYFEAVLRYVFQRAERNMSLLLYYKNWLLQVEKLRVISNSTRKMNAYLSFVPD